MNLGIIPQQQQPTVEMSSSDEDDEDFVPEHEDEHEAQSVQLERGKHSSEGDASVRSDPRVGKMWDDINASTSVSKQSSDKTAKLLSKLTSAKQRKQPKKRKLREFTIPVLSVDVKKSRTDIAKANSHEHVQEVVKFAGVEYSVSKKVSSAAPKTQKLDQLLAAFDAPKKVSTMEKTSLDWDKFKDKEGIEDELAQYTKDGYLEKQEFLQRLDLKRFEIEKAERDRVRRQQQQQALPPQ